MNIEIDPELLEKLVNERVGKAVEDALQAYSVREAISSAISEEVARGAIREAIQQAVGAMDKTCLVKALSEQFQRSTTIAMSAFLVEGAVDTILRMRGRNEYSPGYAEDRARLLAEMRKGNL